MAKECIISVEECEYIKTMYDRKQALDDFCFVLAERSEVIKDIDEMYEKMLFDKSETLHKIECFWRQLEESGRIEGEDGKSFYLDYFTRKVTVH